MTVLGIYIFYYSRGAAEWSI